MRPPKPTTSPQGRGATERSGDLELIAALRRGDEAVFLDLVERHHAALVRVAMAHVPSRAIAEEVAQDAWVGLLQGLAGFEGRSSLKTWLFRILTNVARTRGERERRSIAFSDLVVLATADDEPAVSVERFLSHAHMDPGHWASPPRPWDVPEERLLRQEVGAVADAAIAGLPEAQRQVITLRDVDGFSAAEVCTVLQVTDANQRVLLHRARSKVRAALERYLAPDPWTPVAGVALAEAAVR